MTARQPIHPPVIRRRTRRRGFTLTEIAIVLGVISSILGAIWMAAGQVHEKARATQALNDYGIVSQNMTSLLQGGYGISVAPCAPTAPCDITAAMVTAGVIPPSMNSPPTNPWTGSFYLRWLVAPPAISYRISFYNISHQGCLGLVMGTTSCTPGRPGCPTLISYGGKDPGIGAYAVPAASSAPPITSALAETICNGNTYPGGAGIANSVEFDFAQ